MKFGVIPRYKPPTPSVAIIRRNVPTIVCCDFITDSAAITEKRKKEDVRKIFLLLFIHRSVHLSILLLYTQEHYQALFYQVSL